MIDIDVRLLPRVVVADPPWKFDDDLPGKARGATKHYRTLPARDIEALRLPRIGGDALLFLWRVASMQEEALRVCRAWGFTPKSEMVWVKTDAAGKVRMGMGRYTRQSHESCIIGARGNALRMLIQSRAIPSVFMASRSRHSKKPALFYTLVERLARGPYLELFGREPRAGWEVVGDELGRRLALPLEAAAS